MTIIALDILFVYVILIEVKGIKHMTYDKSNIEFGVIQQKLEKYSNNIKYLAESSRITPTKKMRLLLCAENLANSLTMQKAYILVPKKRKMKTSLSNLKS